MNESSTVMWALNNPDSKEARAALAKSIGDIQQKVEELEEKEAIRNAQHKILLTVIGFVVGVIQPLIIWYLTG